VELTVRTYTWYFSTVIVATGKEELTGDIQYSAPSHNPSHERIVSNILFVSVVLLLVGYEYYGTTRVLLEIMTQKIPFCIYSVSVTL
jgi:hypothetical protein